VFLGTFGCVSNAINASNQRSTDAPLALVIFLPCDFISRSVFNRGSCKRTRRSMVCAASSASALPFAETQYTSRGSKFCPFRETSSLDLVGKRLSKCTAC
jgi:hypothetical protein